MLQASPSSRTLLPLGLSLPAPEDSHPRRFLFSHFKGKKDTLECFQNKEHSKCIQRLVSARSKLNASSYLKYSLTCSRIVKKKISCKRTFGGGGEKKPSAKKRMQ
jgi:hypothetical protein